MTDYIGGVSHNQQDREETLALLTLKGYLTSTTSKKEILIGGHKFTAIRSTTLSKEATVNKYPVEEGFEISDHVSLNPLAFEYEIELVTEKDEYALLDALYQKKTPFSLTTHRGTFDNMIVSKLSDTESSSTNTTTCTVTIQQIQVAETEIVEINNPSEVTTETEENYSGGYTLTVLGKATVAATLPDQTDEQTGVGYCDTLTPSLAATTAFLNRGKTA